MLYGLGTSVELHKLIRSSPDETRRRTLRQYGTEMRRLPYPSHERLHVLLSLLRQGSSASSTPDLERRIDVLSATPAERVALEYFHLSTGLHVAVFFGANFWKGLVLRVGNAEAAVMHAMAAIGQTDRLLEGNPPRSCSTIRDDDPLVITQCKYYIRALTRRASSSSLAAETTLVACILFVCLECSRGYASFHIGH